MNGKRFLSVAIEVWYVIGVATLRALVRAGDQTSGDARSRYQANPKESHLTSVKRIFRYQMADVNVLSMLNKHCMDSPTSYDVKYNSTADGSSFARPLPSLNKPYLPSKAQEKNEKWLTEILRTPSQISNVLKLEKIIKPRTLMVIEAMPTPKGNIEESSKGELAAVPCLSLQILRSRNSAFTTSFLAREVKEENLSKYPNFEVGFQSMAYQVQTTYIRDTLPCGNPTPTKLLEDNKKLAHEALEQSSQLPPPPPPSTNQSDQSTSTTALSSSKIDASAEYTAWTTTDTRLKPSVSSIPEDLHMDNDMAPDKQVYSSGDEDIRHDHIPMVNLKQNWWKPLTKDRPATPEPAWFIPSSDLPVPKNNWASALASTYAPPPKNSLLAQTGDMAIFMDWFCKKQGITELKQQDLEGPAYEIIKVFHPNVIHLYKPLPLGGPPGQVTIQSDFFFNKDLEYLRYGHKSSKLALSILKMKVTYYPDVGLEQMVPDQMWIEEECKYDIDAMYGISHWWFERQRFYIDRHTSEGDRRAVRTHIRILSVFRIEVLSLYGYDYMKNIVLRRADLKEYTITERDFKYLYPSNFEDMYLLNL
ncbi:hypothetical protein Tco_0564311 [Tanacetum coccineum]